MRGEKETGVSIIKISKGEFDAGDVLMQKKIEIDEQDCYL